MIRRIARKAGLCPNGCSYILCVTALLIAACSSPQPPFVATDVEVTKPMPGRHMSAGFLVLTNNTGKDVRVTRVSSPQFGMVEIHETTTEDGVSRMRELDALVVPARGSVTLERGGKHLMLMKANDIGPGVTLHFHDGDTLILTVDYTFPGEND